MDDQNNMGIKKYYSKLNSLFRYAAQDLKSFLATIISALTIKSAPHSRLFEAPVTINPLHKAPFPSP